MITIYDRGYGNFETNGLGELHPISCVVHEAAAGSYELTMVHPMDEDGGYEYLEEGYVIKAPAPIRTAPLAVVEELTSHDVYTVTALTRLYSRPSTTTSTWTEGSAETYGAWSLPYFWLPSGNVSLAMAKPDDELILLKAHDANWAVMMDADGVTGYVQLAHVTLDRTVATAIPETTQERQDRPQLFRIYRVEKDTSGKTVTAYARHVFYDLAGNVLTNCNLDGASVSAALSAMSAACTQTLAHNVYTDSAVTITADLSGKNYVEALLDPEAGLLRENVELVRDNFDVYLLTAAGSERPTPVLYGGNLLGVNVDINEENVVNRIVPIGEDADGDPLFIDAKYVDSPNKPDNRVVRAVPIQYSDIKVGGEYESGGETLIYTEATAKTALASRALAEFSDYPDAASVIMTVDFLQLGYTEEYKQYRDLDRLYLYDEVSISDNLHGVNAVAQVIEYDYDCLDRRYLSFRIGMTAGAEGVHVISGYRLSGNISGAKLIRGSVGTAQLGALAVTSAKIGTAQIGTAHIVDASIVNAHIANAGIDFAKIKDMTAGTAIITTGLADDLYIGRLIVTDANLLSATIGELMVRDDAGDLWKITIAGDGTVGSTAVTMDGANISDNGVMSVSQRLLWRQATAPSAPFVGMLWQDTTADQLKRCIDDDPLTWEIVPAGQVHTSVIDVDDDGMIVASTGTIDLLSGSTLTIKQLGDAANIITMDNTGMEISSTGTLQLSSASQITIGVNSIFDELVVKQSAEPSVTYVGQLWLDTDVDILYRCTVMGYGSVGSVNLIKNSDFIFGSEVDWSGFGGAGEVELSTEQKYGTKATLKIYLDPDGIAAGYRTQIISGITAGSTQTLSFYVYLSETVLADDNRIAALEYHDSSDGLLASHYIIASDAGVADEWVRVVNDYTAPAGTSYIVLACVLINLNDLDDYKAYYTNFQLEDGATVTDWTAQYTAASWENVKADEVHTSYIDIQDNSIDIGSTGEINIESGGTLNLSAASQITIGTNPLAVGGTNLLPNTSMTYMNLVHANSYVWASDMFTFSALRLSVGDVVTARAYIKTTAAVPAGGYRLRIITYNSELSYTGDFYGQYIVQSSEGYSTVTFTIPANSIALKYAFETYGQVAITSTEQAKEIKLEKGSIATEWCESEGELHNSSITIDDGGIEILSGGDLIMTAPGVLKITGGMSADATAISIRNDTDYFISAGDKDSQADCPFWVKKDGTFKALGGIIGGFAFDNDEFMDSGTLGDYMRIQPYAKQIWFGNMYIGQDGMAPGWFYVSPNMYCSGDVSGTSFIDHP